MGTFDLFISYRRKDISRVRPLVSALRTLGVSVWFDQDAIDEFAPITQRIREGLANSKAFLAWYSVDYPRSRPCQMELTAAFVAARRDGDPRKRVWVINPEKSTAHIQPIEFRDEQHALAPEDPQQYENLAGLIEIQLALLSKQLGGIIPLTSPPQYGQRLVSARHFVGRVADFWELHSALAGADTAIISGESSSGLAQLSGIGGVGKSLLAEEYALRFGTAYPGGIFWLRALGNDASRHTPSNEEQSALRSDQLRAFAVSVGIAVRDLTSDEILTKLATKLGNENRPFLRIVDDLSSSLDADTVRCWLSPHPLGKTLITTRSREYQEMGQSVSLGGLLPEDAVELLCSYQKPANPEDRIAAEGIASDLGYHPLALAVCSRALEAEADLRSFAEFRARLASSDGDELELASELGGMLPNGHEKSVASTLLRSVKRLGPEAQDFLRMAASLAPAPIPSSLIVRTFVGVDGLEESVARRRTLQALSQVENSCLAERMQGNSRQVHNLVSRTIRFQDRNDERQLQLRAALVVALNKTLTDVADIRTHKRLGLEVLHAREICTTGIRDANTAALALWVGRHDFERGAYVTARALQEQAFEAYRSFQHPDTLIALNNLAATVRAQGDLERARTLEDQVLTICRTALGIDHQLTRTFMNNVAETLRSQGELLKARILQEEVLELNRRTLGQEHPNTLCSMNNLAVILRDQGDLANARKLHEQVLEVSRRILGEDHADTLSSIDNLAVTLKDQGDLAGAHQLCEQIFEARTRILGNEHPETSMAQWSFLMSAIQVRDKPSVISMINKLSWLLKRDPETLIANQRQIREWLRDLRKL